MLKRGPFILSLLCLLAAPLYGQTHPLMDGPIRSEESSPYDVEMIRTALSISAQSVSVPGMSFVHVTSQSPASDWLALNASGYAVSRVSMHGYVPEWHQQEGILTIQLPERKPGANNRSEWLIKIEYLIGDGLSFRTSTKGRIAVWDGSERGSDIWYPTPVDQLDSYMTQLRVAVPKFWDVWVADGELASHPERVVDGYSKRPVFSGSAAFLAFDTRSSHPDDFNYPVLIDHTEGVSEFLKSLSSTEKLVADYLATLGVASDSSSFDVALTEGLASPTRIGSKLLTSPEFAVTRSPWTDQFNAIYTVMAAVTARTFDSVLPTDSWLATALPMWMSLQAFSKSEGEDAAGLMYEILRDDYLTEAQTYRRPLVWDRWEYPSDMVDEHAKGKGAWVFRMLSERLGDDVLNESVVRFMELAETQVVDSEVFRETLEVVSGEQLTLFFDVWIYSAGHPELTLDFKFNSTIESTEVTIEQHQNGGLVPDAFEFDLAFQYSSLEGTNTSVVRLNRRKQASTIKTTISPRYVFPDAFAAVLLDYYTPLKQDDIVAQLRDAVGPVSKIRSLRHLKRSRPDPAVLLGLRVFLQQESEPAVLASACEMLAEMAPSSSALSMLLGFGSHPDERVRVAAIRGLSHFPDDAKAFEFALNAANTGTSAAVLSESVNTLVTLRPALTWSLVQSALVTPSAGQLVARTALDLVQSGISEDRNLFGAIRPLIEEKNPISLRIAAFRAFARIDSEGQTVKKTIESWLATEEFSLKSAALDALLTYDDIDIKVDSLVKLAEKEQNRLLLLKYSQILGKS